ncbi:uncharacterized protein LOC121008942 isoform X3 [Bufo bufo]|uniref:uncharacterized protein LOC121008942 isoform X3 n=1 Tax=Bufo bufo TaxID=8384 RepID=UPI001ABEDB60|nr:uncharacterized protein LOC121008942 isoform X3 [Bufo bufo]
MILRVSEVGVLHSSYRSASEVPLSDLQDSLHYMEAFMGRIGRVTLGPVPLPYIFVIVLIPFWTSFSSHENSLLFSICVIITVIVKGSLLSCWIMDRVTSWILAVTLVTCVMIAQVIVLQSSLHSSLLSLVVLVPPSTFTTICTCKLHLCGRGDQKDPVPRSGQVIGIFSRSAQEGYAWLTSILSGVGRVVPFTITNSNSAQFRQQVSRCTFSILYHSKTRGRVNITNVTDSLYDDELKHMSKVLGKSKVIVVADDMDDSSPRTEKNILTNQPSIAQLSGGLSLFTEKEKMDNELMKDKVQLIYNVISRGWSSSIISDLVLVFLVIAPWIYFIFSVYHQGARLVGTAAVLVLMVVEMSSLYWIPSSTNMALLLAQSLGTVAFILKISMS